MHSYDYDVSIVVAYQKGLLFGAQGSDRGGSGGDDNSLVVVESSAAAPP